MFSEWLTEETPEQKNLSLYKNKIKELEIEKDDYMFVMLFNGELTKSCSFVTIINKASDKDLMELCTKIYPNNFDIKNDQLIIKELTIPGIQFTPHQAIACNKFIEFMNDSSRKTFGLYGFSGTGKTTTIVAIVSHLLKSKLIKTAAFSAPTNKAVNVMKTKFENSVRDIYKSYANKEMDKEAKFDDVIWKLHDYGVEIEFTTVHRLLGFKTDFNKEDGKVIFVKKDPSDVHKFAVVIIDECSMMSGEMVDCIFNDIRMDGRNIKIVFTGDTAQLPPVNEKNSIIFSKTPQEFPLKAYFECFGHKEIKDDVFNELKSKGLTKKYDILMNEIVAMDNFVMEQVVRSKSNNVLGVCNTIRKWTLNQSETYNIKKFIKGECFAYKYTPPSSNKIKSDWFNHFLEECKKSNECIILTWTNKQCNEYNDAIRKKIFNSDKIERFQVGDILMLSDFYNIQNSKSEENKFYTSEQIKVTSLEIGPRCIEPFPAMISKKAQKLVNGNVYELKYKRIVEQIIESTSKFYKCWLLNVKRLSNKTDNVFTLYVIHEDDMAIYKKDCETIRSIIGNFRNTLTAKYRDKTQVIDNNVIKQLWRDFHYIYDQPFAEVNYGYCITTHKAQGSTFYNVYVDIDDITKNQNINEMKRCFYTAISRTSNELHILV